MNGTLSLENAAGGGGAVLSFLVGILCVKLWKTRLASPTCPAYPRQPL